VDAGGGEVKRGRPVVLRDNPWNLSPTEVQALDLVLKHRGAKIAAHAEGISEKTVESQLRRARERMGAQQYDRLGYILDWQRWRLTGDAA
jgi:DNA-binding CsgD family transcriptional regulator